MPQMLRLVCWMTAITWCGAARCCRTRSQAYFCLYAHVAARCNSRCMTTWKNMLLASHATMNSPLFHLADGPPPTLQSLQPQFTVVLQSHAAEDSTRAQDVQKASDSLRTNSLRTERGKSTEGLSAKSVGSIAVQQFISRHYNPGAPRLFCMCCHMHRICSGVETTWRHQKLSMIALSPGTGYASSSCI